MRILLLDIETAPAVAYIWQLWDKFVPLDRVVSEGYVLCWAAKWYDEDKVMFSSVQKDGKVWMVEQIHKLLDEADAVVHYNGTKFDIPTLHKEFLELGLTPPSPIKEIDLLKTSRKRFKLLSHKLDFVAKKLGVGQKIKHKGMSLWTGCMAGDQECWDVMEDYNKQDVVLLEKVYDKLKPWIKNHANHSIYEGTLCCPNCGSKQFQSRGLARTSASVYRRYACKACGHWFRDSHSERQESKGISL